MRDFDTTDKILVLSLPDVLYSRAWVVQRRNSRALGSVFI